MVNLRHSSHLGTKSNHSASTNVKFFSQVLLLRQQAFSSGNLPLGRPTTTTTAIKSQVFMFRYGRVNSTGKFTIVAKVVSLLKKIYKRDALFRHGFKVKTLAALFPPYLREMKTNTAKFKSAAVLAIAFSVGCQAPVVRKPISANPRLNRPNPQNKFVLRLNSVPRSSISTIQVLN